MEWLADPNARVTLANLTALEIVLGVMMFARVPISRFVNRHPRVKMPALSFLIIVGIAVIAGGLGFHIPRGYIYFAVAFSVAVELLNIRVRARKGAAAPNTA